MDVIDWKRRRDPDASSAEDDETRPAEQISQEAAKVREVAVGILLKRQVASPELDVEVITMLLNPATHELIRSFAPVRAPRDV